MYIDKHDKNGTKYLSIFNLNPYLISTTFSFTPDKLVRYS